MNSHPTKLRWLGAIAALVVAAQAGPALAAMPSAPGAMAADAHAKAPHTALDGYCAVCLTHAGKWIKGDAQHASVYDGQRYLFPSAKEKQAFEQDPAKYVPALGGDCVVCLKNMGKRVPGSVQHSARYRGRLYLFPEEGAKQAFVAAPAKFVDVDLAHNGECAVCLKMNHHVAGDAKFTAYYKGMRNLFPSDKERQAFCKSPAEYEDNRHAAAGGADRGWVSITGRSACAGCSHGVRPLDDPGELGLAVVAADGRVFVIEGAHQAYPELYEKRFDGLRLQVQGVPLKSEDKVSWVRPVDLRVVN